MQRMVNGELVEYVGLVGTSGTPGGSIAISGNTLNPVATVTRPADTTAYASGDLVANSTTALSVTPMSFTVSASSGGGTSIFKMRMSKTGTGVTNAAFRLHLFGVSPTVTNGDNGAFLPSQAANYLGALDVPSMTAFSDGAVGNGFPMIGSAILYKPSSGTVIYGLLEARGAYTPASAEVFTCTLEVLPD